MIGSRSSVALYQDYQCNEIKAHELGAASKEMVLKSLELWPQVPGYLWLCVIYRNIYEDMPKAINFAHPALKLSPTSAKRGYTEDFIRKVQGLLAIQR